MSIIRTAAAYMDASYSPDREAAAILAASAAQRAPDEAILSASPRSSEKCSGGISTAAAKLSHHASSPSPAAAAPPPPRPSLQMYPSAPQPPPSPAPSRMCPYPCSIENDRVPSASLALSSIACGERAGKSQSLAPRTIAPSGARGPARAAPPASVTTRTDGMSIVSWNTSASPRRSTASRRASNPGGPSRPAPPGSPRTAAALPATSRGSSRIVAPSGARAPPPPLLPPPPPPPPSFSGQSSPIISPAIDFCPHASLTSTMSIGESAGAVPMPAPVPVPVTTPPL